MDQGAADPQSDDPSELVGELFAERFRPSRLVSSGANTLIYDAVDEHTGRLVTLKLIQPRLAASPSFRARFDDTMRGVAALSHPNIAAVYDWGLARVGAGSAAYVVIEHLTGGSLRDMFDRGRRLSPSQALAIGLDACRGLDYAHKRGFVHSELTPSKLVFGDDRRLRIIDFGLAKLLGEQSWVEPATVPTHVAWYASPEQAQSEPVDGTTDVYALCLALNEAVTGMLPFAAESTVASLSGRIGRLMPVSADFGPLASVLERAGRPEAHERATAAEFGQGLVGAASKLPRPEPLPLLSTSLFETPHEQLRSPSDPTGGVTRPPGDRDSPDLLLVPVDEPEADDGAETDQAHEADEAHDRSEPDSLPSDDVDSSTEPSAEMPVIVEAEPESDIPTVDPDDDLVILPLDAGIAGDRASSRAGGGAAARPAAPAAAAPRPVAATQVMPTTPAATPATHVRRRRGFPWKIMIALLVLAALGVLGVLATQLFRTPTYLVPELQDMPEAEAINLISANGWEITTERERSDLVSIVGRVVRTAPAAGVELAEGEPFLLVISDGPTLRELPESTGVALSEAQTRLVERGLVANPVEAFDEVVPVGTVVSWSVPGDPTLGAGALVEPETPVELIVSKGPAPRVVPSVVGLAAGDARAAVEGIQLVFAEGEQVFSDDVPLGVVISQTAEPGAEVERGSTISVVVSRGPDLVAFPDLAAAANYNQASALLLAAGFEPRLTFGAGDGAIQSYTIEGRQPATGETFRRGTQVDFVAL